MKDLTLYCHCFPGREPLDSQFNQKNLMCGSYKLSSSERQELSQKNFLFDDQGDNISSLNTWLGDLTGLYWVWKNTNDPIVGTNQYRRFYDTDFIEKLEYDDNTIYISAPQVFKESTYEQFSMHHTEIGLLILNEVARQGKTFLTPNSIEFLKQINYLASCNMFFCDRKLFNKMCELLFSVVYQLYEGTRYALPYIQPMGYDNKLQTRMVAFLGERVNTIIFNHAKELFNQDIKIVQIPWRVKQ